MSEQVDQTPQQPAEPVVEQPTVQAAPQDQPVVVSAPAGQPTTEDPADASMEVDESLPPHLQGEGAPSGAPDAAEAAEAAEGAMETSETPAPEAPIEHAPEEPRPDALHVNGVENLDTRAIKEYIDHYIRPDYSFNTRDQYAKLNYRLEWVNDESVNIVFTHETEGADGAKEALELLTLDKSVEDPILEREAQPLLKAPNPSDPNMEQEEVPLSIRMARYGDHKVKNARIYSRYYLLHGEPDRAQRLPAARERRGRRGGRRVYRPDDEDVITHEKIPESERDLIRDRAGADAEPLRDTWRPEQSSRRRRRGRHGRGRRNDDYRDRDGYDEYRPGDHSDDRRARRRRADEEDDLFPDFAQRKADDREHSPTRQ